MCESSGSFELGPIIVPAALGVGGLLAIGAVTTAATATVSAVDVFVTTFTGTIWADFLVPGAWSIAIGAPVALLASLVMTWRHKLQVRPATPVPPVLEAAAGDQDLSPAQDDDGHCWQCPVRAVPRGMLDAEIPATSTYVTDPELDLVEAAR
jgi:hypothetical protein